MDDDSADAEFLAARDHEDWAKALDETRALAQRRLIQTEFRRKWISVCVATLMERYGKKDAAIVGATTEFHVVEGTVWNALKTHKRDTAREPLSSRLEHNLKIAEGSGNQAAARLLRRLRRRLPTDANTF
jgi:hypothetical protein